MSTDNNAHNSAQRNKTITVAGREITIRELTVGEIGQWLEDKQNPTDCALADPLAALLPVGDMMLGDILRMTDLERSQVDSMTGSQLELIAQGCQAVNRHFFAIAQTLTMAGEMAMGLEQESSEAATPSPTLTQAAQH